MFRPGYHLHPPKGWMNDPNGFIFFKGEYHIFYQHYPYEPRWSHMHWGHFKSKDLVSWKSLPIALSPDIDTGEHGCFSGSAITYEDNLALLYTGHHEPKDGAVYQNQKLAISQDGITFIKYNNNPVIAKPPADSTYHFRDPKVWKEEDTYYMVLGNQSKNHQGRVLLYQSKNLKEWQYLGVLATSKKLGYMWECPDFFKLGDRYVLTFSPMGLLSQEDRFANLYQTGYLIGDYNSHSHQFYFGEFEELDFGHDFYALQTMEDPKGRRIAFGWLDMWEEDFVESKEGWAGMLSLPRELYINEKGRLCQRPVAELINLRGEIVIDKDIPWGEKYLYKTKKHLLEIEMQTTLSQGFGFKISGQTHTLTFSYHPTQKKLIWTRNDEKRVAYYPLKPSIRLQLYIDCSSVELFVDEGAITFSSRFYEATDLTFECFSMKKIKIYELKATIH